MKPVMTHLARAGGKTAPYIWEHLMDPADGQEAYRTGSTRLMPKTKSQPPSMLRTPPASCSRCFSTGGTRRMVQLSAAAKSFHADLTAARKLLTVPADPKERATLAKHYANAALGEIDVSIAGFRRFSTSENGRAK
jgi:hypothetical protein